MKRGALAQMTVAQLRDRFVAIALEQHATAWIDDSTESTRLFWEMEAIHEELKRRPGDQRRVLLPLLDHSNAQVRLESAVANLVLAPEAAQRTLQAVSNCKEFPQNMNARELMRAIDERRYVPS